MTTVPIRPAKGQNLPAVQPLRRLTGLPGERAAPLRGAPGARAPRSRLDEDGSGRLQSVTRERNALFHALISAFERETGIPMLVNTSCNVMGKPISHSATDVLTVFATTGLHALVVGPWLIRKRGGQASWEHALTFGGDRPRCSSLATS